MTRYFENGSGYSDPTLTRVIENENREEKNYRARKKEVHDTINEIKNILSEREMKLYGRIEIEDLLTREVYK